MALFAPVNRVRKWNRAYTIVFGSAAMTALATGVIPIMGRGKKTLKNTLA
jgi:hypothetical protein